jgi:hypothetical protein
MTRPGFCLSGLFISFSFSLTVFTPAGFVGSVFYAALAGNTSSEEIAATIQIFISKSSLCQNGGSSLEVF